MTDNGRAKLRIKVPFADKGDISLKKVGDELVIPGADGGTPSEEKKAEAGKMPEKRADSPASSARFVSQHELTEPASSQEKRLGARLDMLVIPKVGVAADVYALDMLVTQIETEARREKQQLREMAALKKAFDPAGILGRGNIFDEAYLK